MGPGFNQRAVAQLSAKMQAQPPVTEVTALSWWLPDFLPLSAENRHRFLEMRGAKERLAEATRICASVMEVGITRSRGRREMYCDL